MPHQRTNRKPWRPAAPTPTCPHCGQKLHDAQHAAIHDRLWHGSDGRSGVFAFGAQKRAVSR